MEVSIKFIKKSSIAKTPKQIRTGDAGFDLTAVSFYIPKDRKYIEYDTGIAVEIPEGYTGFVYPRSSVSNKALSMANSVGVIDSNYRGTIKVRFRMLEPFNEKDSFYNTYDRVCQLIILKIPSCSFIEVNELSDTTRNDKGFGSSGN